MTDHHHEGRATLTALRPQHKALSSAIPDVYRGYSQMAQAAYADGELPKKIKELIALAIGVVEGCDGCVASHGQSAVRAGASRQEVAEAIGVAFAMHGGPATIHGARAYEVVSAFADDLEAGRPVA